MLASSGEDAALRCAGAGIPFDAILTEMPALRNAFTSARTRLFDSSAHAVAMLATSQLELGGFGPDPAVFNAMERGIGIKMLASAAVFSPRTRASRLVVPQNLID